MEGDDEWAGYQYQKIIIYFELKAILFTLAALSAAPHLF